MENYYDLIGVSQSATPDEIRKAYRDLARQFHPDINPDPESAEKFKIITEGYNLLTDESARKKYDRELDRYIKKATRKKFNAYQKAQDSAKRKSATEKFVKAQQADYDKIKEFQGQRRAQAQPNSTGEKMFDSLRGGFSKLSDGAKSIFFEKQTASPNTTRSTANAQSEDFNQDSKPQGASVNKISIIEVSITMVDVLTGVKKTVEIEEPEGMRKIRVSIPAGVKSGSVVRMRSSSKPEEELVLVVRVARHPFMSIDSRGLIVDIPITPHEAVSGASIKVPTLEAEQILLKVPEGTQSGDELRVRGKGIEGKTGRGDIYYRLMIHLPVNPMANGIPDSAETLSRYYTTPVRIDIPKSLSDLAGKTS